MNMGMGFLIKHQLENLLPIIAFENDSGSVEIDGFSFRSQPLAAAPDTIRTKWESLDSYRNIEPRLPMIGRFLNHISQFVQFEKKGHPVLVTGFRLKNLSRWARYPFPSLFANLSFECITSACSSNCEFCFLDGMGPRKPMRRQMTMQEARTRARYFSPEEKTGLPVPESIPGEPMLHPNFLDFLRMARESDADWCFYITTNGDFLSREYVEELAKLKPLLLTISLNSSNLQTRTQVMKTSRARVGIEAIRLLQEYQIPFIGSLVTSPLFSLQDIENTARYLDENRAAMIRLLLPGYTKFQSVKPFDRDRWWGNIVDLGRKLRTELSTPIHLQPNFYWDREITPRIDGVYRNSPAAHAGLRPGDLILEIDGKPIFTKAEVEDVFLQEPSGLRAVKYERNGKSFMVRLESDMDRDADLYPFKPSGYRMGSGVPDGRLLGIHVTQGFRLEYIRFLKECIEKHPEAKKVLVFTTPLVKEHLTQAIILVGNLPEYRIENVEMRMTIAPQNYWGGNIIVGDLNVAQDYIDHLKELEKYNYRPDLVIIPRSFINQWGFDVSGVSFREIERYCGIPVELLAVERIMW